MPLEYAWVRSGIGEVASRPVSVLKRAAAQIQPGPHRQTWVPVGDVLAGTAWRALVGRPTLVGSAIVTDTDSVDLGFVEQIAPSALDRTFDEQLDVRALWNHDASRPLGRVSAGTLALERTRDGLVASILTPDHEQSVVDSVKRGDVQGMSFAFETLEDEWSFRDGKAFRRVLDMRIHEVSPVTFPAYPATRIGARSLDPDRLRDLALRVHTARIT